MSCVQDTVQYLQMLNRTIEGVKSCPTKYLASINTAQLPLVVVWPGTGVTAPLTSGGAVTMTERDYSIRCYMEPLGQGDFDKIPRDAQVMLDRFINTYMTNRNIRDGYAFIESIRDSGVIAGTASLVGSSQLSYAGQFYRGFTLTLRVKEMAGT